MYTAAQTNEQHRMRAAWHRPDCYPEDEVARDAGLETPGRYWSARLSESETLAYAIAAPDLVPQMDRESRELFAEQTHRFTKAWLVAWCNAAYRALETDLRFDELVESVARLACRFELAADGLREPTAVDVAQARRAHARRELARAHEELERHVACPWTADEHPRRVSPEQAAERHGASTRRHMVRVARARARAVAAELTLS